MATSVSVTTAARRLGLSAREVGVLIRAGRIAPDHDGRFAAAEVEALRCELAAERGRAQVDLMRRATLAGLYRP